MLDLVFCIDCTSSMGGYIKRAKETIRDISQTVIKNAMESLENSAEKSIMLGLVAFRDHPPQDKTFIVKSFPMTASVDEMQENLGTLTAQGGGDGPEAITCALEEAYRMDWRDKAVRIIVLITDAPPHGLNELIDGFPEGCPCGYDPLEVAEKLALKNIIIYTVGVEPALGTYKNGRAFYRAISEITNGRLLSLGNAHLLSDVIVGGSNEELDIHSMQVLVEKETQSLKNSSSSALSLSEIEDEVYSKIKNTGLRTWKLQVTNQINDDEIPDSVLIAKCANLFEARDALKANEKHVPTKPLTMSSYNPEQYASQNVSVSRSIVSKEQVSKCIKKSGGMDLRSSKSATSESRK